MESVNVLVGWALPAELMERIGALDPRIRLLNDRSQNLPRPDVWPPFPFPDQLLPLVPEAQVLLTSRLPANLRETAPHLRWVQLISAGADVADKGGAGVQLALCSPPPAVSTPSPYRSGRWAA